MPVEDVFARLEKERAVARRRLALQVGLPLSVGVAGSLVFWRPMLDQSPTGSVLFLGSALCAVFGVLSIKGALRRFDRHHQETVLPVVMGELGMDVACYADSTPSFLAINRSGVFPYAEQVRSGPLLVGRVDGVCVEAGGLVLTKQKIVRKVRKVQRKVFGGAVYMVDLGPGASPGDFVALGARGRWDRQARRKNKWFWISSKGLPMLSRVYGRVGTDPDLNETTWSALGRVLALHPRAVVSVQDRRHLVVAIRGRSSLFRAAAVFAPLARDARAARSVETMQAIGALGKALGAPVNEGVQVVECEAAPQAPSCAAPRVGPADRMSPEQSMDAGPASPLRAGRLAQARAAWAQVPGTVARLQGWAQQAWGSGRSVYDSCRQRWNPREVEMTEANQARYKILTQHVRRTVDGPESRSQDSQVL